MDVSLINENYQQVMTAAKASRRETPDLGINALLEKPAFYGFVEVSFLKDINVCMFVGGNDDGVALRCLWNGPYEPMSLALWSELAKSATCIVDIGAHSGIYSLVAHASRPDAAVISFEPYALNFARLSLNLRANGFRAGLAIQSALSNTEGVIPFSVPPNAWYLSAGGSVTPNPEARTVPVNCTSLNIIRSRINAQPNLIKIDVEGHELQVLQGSSDVLDALSPDLIIESVFNQDTAAIEDLLTCRGYRFYVIEEDTKRLTETDHLCPASADSINMNRLNRFVTKRSASEIAGFEAAAQAALG